MHSLIKKVFQRTVFTTYFAWNRYFLISEWFPTVRKHIKVREAEVRAKYFTTKKKVLINKNGSKH